MIEIPLLAKVSLMILMIIVLLGVVVFTVFEIKVIFKSFVAGEWFDALFYVWGLLIIWLVIAMSASILTSVGIKW